MKERPILFSAPMVTAILGGRKTQTRRVFKQAVGPSLSVCMAEEQPGVAECSWLFGDGPGHDVLENLKRFRCPYGAPGDRLWVRETWAHYQTVSSVRRPSGASFAEVSDGLAGYRADGHETIEDFRKHVQLMSGCDLEAVEINGDRWRPSIHMPRWASRINLEVTGVRVERLQDITILDASAEGCYAGGVIEHAADGAAMRTAGTSRDAYQHLWGEINGAESWAANPWVWVVEFRKL